jgi:hypothetical protein
MLNLFRFGQKEFIYFIGMKGIFIAMIIFCVSATWNEPVDLKNSSMIFLAAKDVYSDPSTGMHHIILGNSNELVEYWQVSRENKITFKKALNIKIFKRGLYVRITGAGDGKRLYLVITAFTGTPRIEELYYSESENNGVTWSQLSVIPNKKDTFERICGSLLFIPESERIFVFYHLITNKDQKIAYVTKPKGSLVFSEEKIAIELPKDESFRRSLTAVSTSEKGKTKLHIFWANPPLSGENNRNAMRSTSEDNGVTWTTPNLIKERNDVEFDLPFLHQQIVLLAQ